MELGAGVELSTVAAPFLFLPLACAANITKNVAVVSSTSTRAPIYKAFALRENMGDVTAKGECISNIADLLGTGLGILISRNNPCLLATFMVLSCGYVYSSYQEVKSVMMPTLNRARFGVAVRLFLETGDVPSLYEGNRKERIILPPWAEEKSVELGSCIKDAFASPQHFIAMNTLFKNENYLVTYLPTRRRAYAVLKERATSDDVLQAAFHAHLVLHVLRQGCVGKRDGSIIANKSITLPRKQELESLLESVCKRPQEPDVMTAIADSCRLAPHLYEAFKHKAEAQGWILGESSLNPGDVRLCWAKKGKRESPW